MSQFIETRHQKKPSTHLLSVIQPVEKSLKDSIVRFNADGTSRRYNDGVALTTMMVGLKLGKFLWSLLKNPLRTYTNLLRKAQRYSITEKLYSTRHNFELLPFIRLPTLKECRGSNISQLISRVNTAPSEIELDQHYVHSSGT